MIHLALNLGPAMNVTPTFSPNASNNGFPGNDFSNNIFTDLAPLLTLFGDQMTKQFLSMSMGWADNFLIAVCPIGILTVVVSAIRIGGGSRLKTLIGRARESRSAAELELLSATSGEVCEMWSGSEIVRVAGQPATTQYIIDKTVKPETIITLSEALEQSIYLQNSDQTDLGNSTAAPSLTMNVRNAVPSSWQLMTLVVVGILIQLIAFVLSAVIVYGWSWRAGSDIISSYGFPCYLIGTLLLTLGLLGCARVIQDSSSVDELSPKDLPAGYQPFCVQKACTVDDKHFLSYAIFHPEGTSTIKVSISNGQEHSLVTLCSTVVALIGYVCQFVGLRAMHWSVALVQLAATLTMTCARAFIRRGLANQPVCQPLPMGTDAAGLAYLFSGISTWELVTGASFPNEPTHATLSDVEYIDPGFNMPPPSHKPGVTAEDLNSSNNLIMIARSIGRTVPPEYPTSPLAEQLVNAIHAIMQVYTRRHAEGVLDGEVLERHEHCWEVQPLLQMEGEIKHMPMKTFLCSSLFLGQGQVGTSRAARENSALIADPKTISALLSLWLAVLARRFPLNRARAQEDSGTARRSQYYRIISNDCVPQGVPQGKALGKWLSSQSSLHTTTLTQVCQLPKDRQARTVPMFGVFFSSRHLRFKAIPDPYRISIDETIPDPVEPDALPFSDPSVSWTRATRALNHRNHVHSPITDNEDNAFAFLRGLTLSEQRAALRRAFRDGSTNRSTEVAVVSSSSLERNCALELFTIFMLSLTSQISQVKGRTANNQGPKGETWMDDTVSEMGSAIAQAGFAEDEAEALTLVVPAFAARGLLPTELS